MTIALAAPTRFHVGFYCDDLKRSIGFYRTLLGVEAVAQHDDYARFESADPPLVLSLLQRATKGGGPLNHVGIRLAESDRLVEIQRRLEEAGIATQRQDGVECCYARQTKFWVTDPDRVLWELYVLEEDIDHSGFDDPPLPQPADEPWDLLDDACAARDRWVMYRGPFENVTGDDGTLYTRGQRVAISARKYSLLRAGSAAQHFVFLPQDQTGPLLPIVETCCSK